MPMRGWLVKSLCRYTLSAALHMFCSWGPLLLWVSCHTHLCEGGNFFQHFFCGAGGFNSLPACEATAKVLASLFSSGFPRFRVLDKAVPSLSPQNHNDTDKLTTGLGEGVAEIGSRHPPKPLANYRYVKICVFLKG